MKAKAKTAMRVAFESAICLLTVVFEIWRKRMQEKVFVVFEEK